jgi:putative ABC transport system permease protein
MLREYFGIAFNNLRQRKLRSWLTMLGIFIGIAAVVSLISLSKGMQDAITNQFEKLGSDVITVQAAGNSETGGSVGSSAKLTDDDIHALERVSGVSSVSGRLLKTGKVQFNRQTVYTIIAGLNLDSQSLKLLDGTGFTDVLDGRMLRSTDTGKIVIGNDYTSQDNTFKKSIQVGNTLVINDVSFQVVGILKKSGTFFVDNTILMSKDKLRDISGITDKEESAIAVRLQKGADMNTVVDNIERQLRRTRNVEKGKEDFSVTTPQQLLNTFLTIFNIITGVVVGVAGISLIVGGVGIMNTMYTSVLERRREIGIIKAIGARNSHVFLLFLIESGFLGLAGGVIGCVLGLSLSKSVEVIATKVLGTTIIEASLSPWLIFGALSFSFIVGSIAGTFPAMQASRMNPVDALKRT